MRSKLNAKDFTKGVDVLPVVIQKTAKIDNDYATILFTLGAGNNERASEQRVAESISKLYKNKVRLCEGTVMAADETASGVFQAVVARNAETIPYETASAAGFKVTAANMFMDETDQLWEVGGEGENRVLRRLGNDDLSAVLEERRSRSMATACVGIDIRPEVGKHAAVMFFDTAKEELAFGIMVGKETAYVNVEGGQGELAKCPSASVLAFVEHDEEAPAFNNAPSMEKASTADVLAYYKMLYGHNAAFYNHLASLVREHMKMM
jgi:hypothetical protein